ncbi:hypothetical protein BDM02DRAFT_3108178 [Thelephora ganbajun]|uniref:Uncharacterized protein n=1 Tax=Thelephora ganbajun TaxID=370292 RepID=A0ACB6ZT88_THEGA|nr:hypothetical protein BDM02DRAFT_3108178 [Thelephora ganbajun]
MEELLEKIRIPPEYAHAGDIQPQDITDLSVRLERWRMEIPTRLRDLASYLAVSASLSTEEQSLLVIHAAQFVGDDPWASTDAQSQAEHILENHVSPNVPLITQVLFSQVRPVFQSHAHPKVNLSTGRVLSRVAGGPLASQDLYTSQSWKESHPGISNVLLWVVARIKSLDYDRLWHLVVPPVMILLDDYEVAYKLRGISIISRVLKTVPPDLLRRTGVDELIFSSLKGTLVFLHNPKTPELLSTSIPTIVELVDLLFPVAVLNKGGGKQRFDRLCSVLGEGVIGNVWIHASRDVGTIRVTIDQVPLLVESLGICVVRYLKPLILQLLDPLYPPPPGVQRTVSQEVDELRISSLRSLSSVIKTCRDRISAWKKTILNAVARCWVWELEKPGLNTTEIRLGLREVIASLSAACPSIIEHEIPRLKAAYPALGDILPDAQSIQGESM